MGSSPPSRSADGGPEWLDGVQEAFYYGKLRQDGVSSRCLCLESGYWSPPSRRAQPAFRVIVVVTLAMRDGLEFCAKTQKKDALSHECQSDVGQTLRCRFFQTEDRCHGPRERVQTRSTGPASCEKFDGLRPAWPDTVTCATRTKDSSCSDQKTSLQTRSPTRRPPGTLVLRSPWSGTVAKRVKVVEYCVGILMNVSENLQDGELDLRESHG